MTSEVIEGTIRSFVHLKIHLFFNILFVWNLILSKIGINANTIKTQIFHNMKFDLKGHWRLFKMQIFDDMKFDLIIILTYVLVDNVCPCFYKSSEFLLVKLNLFYLLVYSIKLFRNLKFKCVIYSTKKVKINILLINVKNISNHKIYY